MGKNHIKVVYWNVNQHKRTPNNCINNKMEKLRSKMEAHPNNKIKRLLEIRVTQNTDTHTGAINKHGKHQAEEDEDDQQ